MRSSFRFAKLLAALPLMVCSSYSCASKPSVVGKWETVYRSLGNDTMLIPVAKDDWFYFAWEFKADGKLLLNQRRTDQKSQATYVLRNDTLIVTAENGFVSVTPVLKLTSTELRMRSIVDNNVSVYKRVR